MEFSKYILITKIKSGHMNAPKEVGWAMLKGIGDDASC